MFFYSKLKNTEIINENDIPDAKLSIDIPGLNLVKDYITLEEVINLLFITSIRNNRLYNLLINKNGRKENNQEFKSLQINFRENYLNMKNLEMN